VDTIRGTMTSGFFRRAFGRAGGRPADGFPDDTASPPEASSAGDVTSRPGENIPANLDAVIAREREAARRAGQLDQRERELGQLAADLEAERERLASEGELLAGLSREQARRHLLAEAEQQTARQNALMIRRREDEARLEADRRARGILAVAMQRLASAGSMESNTTAVHLPEEAMKGRIIGKDGRNIRALESLTGVDIIIDETPETVVLSSFDPVRREVARLTLERLVGDGRIHPASIETAFEASGVELDDQMAEAAESALLEARVGGVHPELVRLLGRLRFRTSYSQNVLAHLVETANLAAMMAAELGASVELARRAAMLHDIGKAVSHEVEGTHAAIGARLARRHDESEEVANAIEAHHGEVEPATVEAVLVQAADALSGARPGARSDSLEQYVTRLGDLEEIASRPHGVRKVYAMKAGREIRVIVDPGKVDDRELPVISTQVAAAIEQEMKFPGQITITVIREVRSSATAR